MERRAVKMERERKGSGKVTFVHLDLGLGGAEQLVVYAALAMQQEAAKSAENFGNSQESASAERDAQEVEDAGYDVEILTTHHDTTRCFPATVDGRLRVSVYGRFLPRSLGARAVALCSLLRMLWLCLVLLVTGRWRRRVIFCDQVSAINPLLSFFTEKLVFYAHFPDMLLAARRDKQPQGVIARIKALYRALLDAVEQATTGRCDVLLFNSRFTEATYRRSFPSMRFPRNAVLYPPVDTRAADAFLQSFSREACVKRLKRLPEFKHFDFSVPFAFSLNRYEAKKGLPLALQALAEAQQRGVASGTLNLVVAGGFDGRLRECVEIYGDLVRLGREQLNFEVLTDTQAPSSSRETAQKTQLLLLKNISDETRQCLMAACLCVIYTPHEEHFGMVPCEAMALGCPVIASDSGGPRESVLHGETGFLCEHDAQSFGDALLRIVRMQRETAEAYEDMRRAGRRHAKEKFSFEVFRARLRQLINED
ncbi:glycosyltransferase, group 1 family protein [Besnoitia besnoiti]|uniref:Alpha-1,3/1,6-mannosyltransferase ALG2 n=1 Tax=Besnoitia besnoiti TaxID=94643 RepID=A0A2A9MAW7_BESBE|nr:glycosyltransferase, group 1 family protein [Besnoitia besnoiti]PFH35029.1 glycosyltransferase, group 1 family protein [Besnoitia besnoiti]